jgi:type IV pilus biogenesis protein CpaD/CtpE
MSGRQSSFGTALVVTAMMTVGGCTEYLDHSDKIAPFAGDASKSNIAAQMIDPWPRHSGNRHIHADGDRMAIAIKRYKENKSLEPEGIATSSMKIESGGGEKQ